MYDLIERLNKFKKDFAETDLSNYKNKVMMFERLCDIVLDLSIYALEDSKIDDVAKAARLTCEEDS